MIRDYKIISAGQSTTLERAVKKWMKEGWTPFGSPFSTSLHMYNQAMIGEADDD